MNDQEFRELLKIMLRHWDDIMEGVLEIAMRDAAMSKETATEIAGELFTAHYLRPKT